MYKRLLAIPIAALLLVLTACGNGGQSGDSAASNPTRSINYLGNTYKIPARTKDIVYVGFPASYEDSFLLGIPPVAATMDKNGKFPAEYQAMIRNAKHLPWNIADNLGELVALKPDVIMTTDKTSKEDLAKLQSAASVIPVSTNGAHWQENLRLLADVRGKDANLDTFVGKVKQNALELRDKLAPLPEKKVLTVWFEEGSFYIYPKHERYNYLLYTNLALPVPDVVANVQERTALSMDALAKEDPNYLFVMVNREDQPAFKQLQEQPAWTNLNAVKADQMYMNAVEPGLAGGTAYSNQSFLNAIRKQMLKMSE
ncbi:ABC transporter substrate-binding protein [Brevibacillus fortis]|uniref:ABC transporter substrate-binding protein n=1 Tax=Brevibacillus fortis TaxID=2126352 RepID=A0A2P7V5Q6_9BACL|nr:ABC transporter substrate-binding protein [Brevibacillus fortis]PSJ94540.1 ABC transporter substrate-binding protein [Brevibacillus fortis]